MLNLGIWGHTIRESSSMAIYYVKQCTNKTHLSFLHYYSEESKDPSGCILVISCNCMQL